MDSIRSKARSTLATAISLAVLAAATPAGAHDGALTTAQVEKGSASSTVDEHVLVGEGSWIYTVQAVQGHIGRLWCLVGVPRDDDPTRTRTVASVLLRARAGATGETPALPAAPLYRTKCLANGGQQGSLATITYTHP